MEKQCVASLTVAVLFWNSICHFYYVQQMVWNVFSLLSSIYVFGDMLDPARFASKPSFCLQSSRWLFSVCLDIRYFHSSLLLDFSGGSLLPVCYGNILVNDSCWVRYADMRITDCGDNMHVCNLLVCVYFCGTADYVCRCITDWMHVWMGCTHVWMYVPDYTASECILTSTHQLIFRESVAGISQ